MSDILLELQQTIDQRKQAGAAEQSYVASLHGKGLNKILEKVGEECVETLIAAKDAERSGDARALIGETADLWFHSLVMLSCLDVSVESVLAELRRRTGQSGLAEKKARGGT